MKNYKQNVIDAADYLKARIQRTPEILLCAGTGLGECAGSIEVAEVFDYRDIPNFPSTTVESHAGCLVFGTMKGRPIAAMMGRFHLYEGYSPKEVSFPVRVMQMLGVRTLIVSNASGGLNSTYSTGDIMVIKDHINLTGENPLAGSNEDEWGLRFPDMISAYDDQLATLALRSGKKLGFKMQQGVYAGLKGPSLETPAEMKFLQVIGADSVGFSTIQEVIAGVHANMNILGLSVITNINDPGNPQPATVEGVIEVAGKVAPKLEKLIGAVVEAANE